MKRVYETVAAEPAPAELGAGFVIRLDGRTLKSPAKAALLLPNAGLAEAVAAEWDAQEAEVRPAEMPLTALAATAVDLVAPHRAQVVDDIAAYAETDLVCYQAERPPALVARQKATWQPLVDWAALALDAPLRVTQSILPTAQPPEAVAALRSAVEALDSHELTALSSATKAAASLVIGLALCRGRLSAEQAFEAAELDESYQMELWGEDAEALQRRAAIRADLEAAERFLSLLRA